MWDFFGNLGRALFGWLGDALSYLFSPLVDLVDGVVYFLGGALNVVIKAVQVLLYMVQALAAFGGGLVRSFTALAAFDPATITADPNPYAQGTSLLFDQWAVAGGNVVAGVLTWGVWFLLAVAVTWLFLGRRAAA